jgi:hypothetical protein
LRRDVSEAAATGFANAAFGEFADLWTNPSAFAASERIADLRRLPQSAQEAIAAGFEYVGRRPGDAHG